MNLPDLARAAGISRMELARRLGVGLSAIHRTTHEGIPWRGVYIISPGRTPLIDVQSVADALGMTPGAVFASAGELVKLYYDRGVDAFRQLERDRAAAEAAAVDADGDQSLGAGACTALDTEATP